jgi:hypothetical protein
MYHIINRKPEKNIFHIIVILSKITFLFTVEYYSTLILMAKVFDQDLDYEEKN